MLVPLQTGIPIILYITTTNIAMGAILTQKIEAEERVIYYLSKKFLEYETLYYPLENTTSTLVRASKKLTHCI